MVVWGPKTDDAFRLLVNGFGPSSHTSMTLAVSALSTILCCLFFSIFFLFSRSAKALLDDGQPHAAVRLLRQALQQGYDPLGTATYASACFTQHVNMLRGWGSEVGWCFFRAAIRGLRWR